MLIFSLYLKLQRTGSNGNVCRQIATAKKKTTTTTMTTTIRKKGKTIKYFPRLFIFITWEQPEQVEKENKARAKWAENSRYVHTQTRDIDVAGISDEEIIYVCVCVLRVWNEIAISDCNEPGEWLAVLAKKWCAPKLPGVTLFLLLWGTVLSIQMVFNIVYFVYQMATS